MCVILAADSRRPSTKALELALAANPHGAGIAWLDEGRVRFYKGASPADVEHVMELAATVPLPYIVHFRIATVGEVCDELCHPFPMGGGSFTRTAGISKRGVLFHNGTWTTWRKSLLDAAAATGTRIGDGPMSDARAMAHLAVMLGPAILGAIEGNQRIALLTPKGIRTFGEWTTIKDGLRASNMRWARETRPDPYPEPAESTSRIVSRVSCAVGAGRDLEYERDDATRDARSDRSSLPFPWDKAARKGGR